MARSKPSVIIPRRLLTGGASLLGALPGLAPTFAVVALLACVLVPLPTGLVDLLLSVSLAGAVLLLVASLGVRRSADFLGFPSLLLLATLYRLALNVSTTRLILSQADAGQVVDAFASVVVRGDLVVGGVMFAIISVIQYLVIARGSERIAEVAARFALDGLPGHQQAIEADVRAGLLSSGEAARRRDALAERSSFYGAMDGAIRFVKGDAVAGLAITTINLTGGLAIGVGQLGYSWSESLELYGRLTIGDGLLAQLPALLVSLAAGVLVSRVDAKEPEPLRWLDPAMLLVPAVLLVVLAVVPGMPSLAFAATATMLVTGALWLAARSRPPSLTAEDPGRLQLRCHPAAVTDARGLERALVELGARCQAALGIEVPPIALQLEPSAPRERWELWHGERRLLLVSNEPPLDDDELLLASFRALMEHAPSLLGLEGLERELETLRGSHPVLVRRALEGLEPRDLLVIIRGFLRERLRCPPLPAILAVIAEDRRFDDPAERPRHAELVRERLAPYWLPGLLDGLHRLGPPRVVRLTPDAEEELGLASVATGERVTLRISAAARERWQDSVRDAAAAGIDDDDPSPPGPTVLLSTPRARPVAAALVSGMMPHIPVISTAELKGSTVAELAPARWLDPPS